MVTSQNWRLNVIDFRLTTASRRPRTSNVPPAPSSLTSWDVYSTISTRLIRNWRTRASAPCASSSAAISGIHGLKTFAFDDPFSLISGFQDTLLDHWHYANTGEWKIDCWLGWLIRMLILDMFWILFSGSTSTTSIALLWGRRLRRGSWRAWGSWSGKRRRGRSRTVLYNDQQYLICYKCSNSTQF